VAFGVSSLRFFIVVEWQVLKTIFNKTFFSWSKLEARGLRFVYRENDNKFSNDVEPEYITYNKNETKAYVCLQVRRIIFLHYAEYNLKKFIYL